MMMSFDRLAREEGPAAAVGEIERRMHAADEPTLLQLLRQLGKIADPAALPAICRCLPHTSEAVRDTAKRALQAIGHDRTIKAVEEQARRADPGTVGVLLDGLAVFEARADLVALLDRLVDFLQGELL